MKEDIKLIDYELNENESEMLTVSIGYISNVFKMASLFGYSRHIMVHFCASEV